MNFDSNGQVAGGWVDFWDLMGVVLLPRNMNTGLRCSGLLIALSVLVLSAVWGCDTGTTADGTGSDAVDESGEFRDDAGCEDPCPDVHVVDIPDGDIPDADIPDPDIPDPDEDIRDTPPEVAYPDPAPWDPGLDEGLDLDQGQDPGQDPDFGSVDDVGQDQDGTGGSDPGRDSCSPACDGLECGDDGCGGLCGTCPPNHACIVGKCVVQPWCGDWLCNAGETCASCPGDCVCGCGRTCLDGQCVFTACDGRDCGADGCGGSCGTCPENHDCRDGACVEVHWCGDGFCNSLCGEDCSNCPTDCACGCGETCTDGECLFTACDGLECGDDGCGDSCGTCADFHQCEDGICVSR